MDCSDRLLEEGIMALERLQEFFKYFPDDDNGCETEMLSFVGLALCRDGISQLNKVWDEAG